MKSRFSPNIARLTVLASVAAGFAATCGGWGGAGYSDQDL